MYKIAQLIAINCDRVLFPSLIYKLEHYWHVQKHHYSLASVLLTRRGDFVYQVTIS